MSNLPVRPSLTSLRKQVKSVLKGVRENDPEALEQVREHHPSPDSFSTLRDAQLVVARKYGHPGWAELCTAVENAVDNARSLSERAALFADLACLLYTPEENISRRARATRLLLESPEIPTVDVHAAAAAFDVQAMNGFIKRQPDCVNQAGGVRNWPPLIYLAYSRLSQDLPDRDAMETARLLIEAGADAAYAGALFAGGWRWTPLTGAIGEGESGVVQQPPHPRARELAELLLDAGADPNDSQGLYNSMFTPGNEWLELLLSRGLTAGAQADPDGNSKVTTLDYQLAQAVKAGHADRVVLLLQHGAAADGSDETYTGKTQVEQALLNGFADIAALLVQHGAKEVELSHEERFRAAVMGGDVEEAKRLLNGNASLAKQPDLLVNAAGSGRSDSVEFLLDLGANPNELAGNGRGALHEAAWSGHSQVVKLMLERGARPEVRDKDHDSTPAGFANHAGQFDVRDLLLDYSRDVFDLTRFGKAERLRDILGEQPALAASRDGEGRTPLHSIDTGGPSGAAVLDLLLEHGADINAAAEDGATPLSLALEREDVTVADLLKERGAK